jgi:hypothetical protein
LRRKLAAGNGLAIQQWAIDHAIARSLRGQHHTIGLLVQSLLTTYVGLLVNAVEDNPPARDMD